MHTKQFENFDGRTRTDSNSALKKQPSSVGLIYFSDVNPRICKLLRLLNNIIPIFRQRKNLLQKKFYRLEFSTYYVAANRMRVVSCSR
jgi:hypothetical protein